MSSLSEQQQPGELSLRERKKIKTRAAIQRHALRLFRERGYAQTTVEQIAAAAEVSPSTFFRYFPTKEDVVLRDDYDELMLAAFHAQPADVPPIRALREAIAATIVDLSPEQREVERQRQTLINTVPEVRARLIDELGRTIQFLAEAVAARVGRQPDELAVRTFTGAVIGVSIACMFAAVNDPTIDHHRMIVEALAQLESGLPL
jgi:AcrR family transcriptional regulator